MNKQYYVLEMNNFTEEEAQDFLNTVFHDAKWGTKQGMALSHLTEKGVRDLKQHVFKEEPQ
ncbi:hypothetical protein [Atopococcus tabaci]|uniref:hypothetical protein n=1 Tax=Atopococcus tabaci TaxID=269774 RepID=UPI0024099C71|nr:hypothetical protein [Atopococcus tabaci]